MSKLSDAVKNAISAQDVFPVATCNASQVPNVAYVKYLKVVDDNTVLMADNYFAKTRENILANSNVSFVVLDEEKGSYQIKGKAKRLEEGPMFDEVQTWVPEKLPRAAAVVMDVEEVYNGAAKLS